MNIYFDSKSTSRRLLGLRLITSLILIAVGYATSAVATRAAEQPVLKPNFAARDATRFKEDPDLSKFGLKNITVAYESSLWPSGASHTQPDTTYIANSYIPKIRASNPDVVVIDIESWPFTSAMTATEITANITKFKKVISVFRRELPTAKIGFYLIMPERNWLAPCGDPKKVLARTNAWHLRNMKLQPLADAVDIIFPSIYTFYEDAKSQACWPTYAAANISEAKSYGKPVWAFLWMKYHTTGNWIPATFWRQQLETTYEKADGFAIWSMASASDPWSYTSPWWVETASFLKAKGLSQ
jgi:hypothetical protein